MFCPNCEKRLPDDAAFCSACGAKLQTSGVQAPAVEAKKNKLGKQHVWPILLLALLLITVVTCGFRAYRKHVVEPREQRAAVDELIRCLKKSDAYESADDFRMRVADPDYDYNNYAVSSDYGYRELADYFDKLFRDENYAEYIHDLSVLLKNGYTNSVSAAEFMSFSALEKLWDMGSPISPDDVSRDWNGGVYFRGVPIEDYDHVEDPDEWLGERDDPEECYGIINGHVYGSIFVWPILLDGDIEEPGFIVIDAENDNYVLLG